MWLQNSQWDFGCLVVVDMVKTDIQNILYMVVCQGVIDHLAIPAGFHQITQPQSLQLMGDGRFGHAKQSRQIADAHLVQLQSMEDLHPGRAARLRVAAHLYAVAGFTLAAPISAPVFADGLPGRKKGNQRNLVAFVKPGGG